MTGAWRDALAAGTLLALALGPATAGTELRPEAGCTREDARSAAAAEGAGGPGLSTPAAEAITAEATETLPPVTVESRPLPATPRPGFWAARFADHFVDHFDVVTRLRAIRRLKILPLFDNAQITVFFGIDRKGVAGLHLQQQDASDLPPLLARAAPLTDPPPLRALPRQAY